MKRLLLLLVVLCTSCVALAQVRDVGPRHEVRLGLGVLATHSATSGFYTLAFDERNASFGDRYLYSKVSQGTITQTPSFNLSYTYRVKSWFEVGALLSYDCIYSPTYHYKTGEKITPSFAGIQSLCGDAFSNPYLSEGVNFTLGCDGSRKAADIKDNEMTVGISKAKIEEVISGLESI